MPNPNGIRIIAAPVVFYCSWFIYTNDGPWPIWFYFIWGLAFLFSIAIYRADKKKREIENALKNSVLTKFDFELPSFLKDEQIKPIEREINAFHLIQKGIFNTYYSKEEALKIAQTLMQTQNYDAASKWFSLAIKSKDPVTVEQAEIGQLLALAQQDSLIKGNFDTYQLTLLHEKGFIKILDKNNSDFSYILLDKSSEIEAINSLPEIQRQLLITLITEVMVQNGRLEN